MIIGWMKQFDDRQKKEILFSRVYASEYNHGTDGHNAKLIIATMAQMLDEIHYALAPIGDNPEFAVKTKREIAKIMGFTSE